MGGGWEKKSEVLSRLEASGANGERGVGEVGKSKEREREKNKQREEGVMERG